MSFNIPGFEYTPSSGDRSIELLRGIFGGASEALGGSLGPISDVIGVFNAAVMAVAAVLAFVLVMQAVVGTAHDGSVLGKRFNSMWVPIRSMTAAALLVPAVGGFNGVQLLVLSLSVQGVGLADKMTAVGVDAVLKGGLTPPAVLPAKAGEELSKGLIQIAACMSANEKLNAAAGTPSASYGNQTTSPKGAVVVEIGLDFGDSRHSCGEFSVSRNETESTRFAGAAAKLQAAQVSAAVVMYQEAKAATDAASARTANVDYTVIRAAMTRKHDEALTKAMQEAVKAAAATGQPEHAKAIEDIKRQGWLSLGGASFKLAAISSEISSSIKLAAVEASPRSAPVNAIESSLYRSEIEAITASVNRNNDSKVAVAVEGEKAGWLSGMTQKFVNEAIALVTEGPFNAIKAFTQAGTGNPLLDVKHGGDLLLDAGSATTIAALLMSAAAAPLGGAVIVLALAAPVIVLLFTLGATMSIWIPLIPFTIFISVAIAWLTLVVESVVAAGIWLLLWFSGENEGLVAPGGEQGIRFLAGVIFMPALTVVAFFAASILTILMGGWVQSTFADVVRSMNSTTLGAVVMVLGYCVLFVAINITLISKLFGMCLTMPSTVLKWIGGGFNGGESLERNVEGQNNTLIAPISGFASKATPHRPRGGGGGSGGGAKSGGGSEGGGGGGSSGGGLGGGSSTSGVDSGTDSGTFNTADASAFTPYSAGASQGVTDVIDKSASALPAPPVAQSSDDRLKKVLQ